MVSLVRDEKTPRGNTVGFRGLSFPGGKEPLPLSPLDHLVVVVVHVSPAECSVRSALSSPDFSSILSQRRSYLQDWVDGGY